MISRMINFLQNEYHCRRNLLMNANSWKVRISNEPTQENLNDCGVFICAYANQIGKNVIPAFRQEHIPMYRQKMMVEIRNKCLFNDYFDECTTE